MSGVATDLVVHNRVYSINGLLPSLAVSAFVCKPGSIPKLNALIVQAR